MTCNHVSFDFMKYLQQINMWIKALLRESLTNVMCILFNHWIAWNEELDEMYKSELQTQVLSSAPF